MQVSPSSALTPVSKPCPSHSQKPTVLIIDNEISIRLCMKQGFLSNGSFNILVARNVSEAIGFLSDPNNKIDYVISDGFGDHVGGELGDLLDGFSSSPNNYASLIIYTGGTTPEMVRVFSDRNTSCEVVDKSCVAPHKLVDRVIEMREAKKIALVNAISLPQAQASVSSLSLPMLNIRMPLDEVTEGVLKSDLGANQKILVVDDNSETIERLSRVLGKYFTSERGNQIFMANTAFEAVNIVREKGITLLCTDLYMEPENGIREHPDLTNGDELLKALGKDCPSVVIVSGSWSDDKYANLAKAKDSFTGEATLEYRLKQSTIDHRLANTVVPILGASKTKVFYDEALLVKLCLSALSMGQDKQPDIVERFLSTFSPKMKENEKVENSSIVKIEEALLLAQADFLQVRDKVDLNEFSVGRDELEKIFQGVINEFSVAIKITRKLYKTDNRARGLHDIVNKCAAVASYIGALSGIFEQSGKTDLAGMTRECERLISDHAGSVIRSSKARIEALTEPQNFLLEDEIKTLIGSEFTNKANIIEVSSSNTFIHGLKTDYLDLVKQLVMNSTKATRETVNPEIKVNLLQTEDHIVIEVSDNGCGMNESQLSAINSKQNLPSTFGTSGEGMRFIYRTLEKLNADMEVSSAGTGTGAIFKITIPKNNPTSVLPHHQQSQLVPV